MGQRGRGEGDESWIGRAVSAGAVAGVAGGVALAAAAVFAAGGDRHAVWSALQAPAYPLLGTLALSGRPVPLALLLGAALHLGVAAAWGVLFGIAVEGQARTRLPALGLLWGIAVYVIMFGLVLPMIDARTLAAVFPARRALCGHALYGLVTALSYLPLARGRSQLLTDEAADAVTRPTPRAAMLAR
jgi:hypothetical protein